MNKSTLPYLILAAALIASIVQAVSYGPQLPETVASHFGAKGAANGWMSRGAFIAVSLVVQFGMALFMIGLSQILGRLPTSMINIPNREFWLADERREETLRDNRLVLVWITAVTAVFLLLIFQLSIEANLNPRQGINSLVFAIVMCLYLGIIFTLTIRMSLRYKRVPNTPNSS